MVKNRLIISSKLHFQNQTVEYSGVYQIPVKNHNEPIVKHF